jgi:hypothetical protein
LGGGGGLGTLDIVLYCFEESVPLNFGG